LRGTVRRGRGLCVCDDELQTPQRPGWHWGRITEDDRTTGTARCELSETLITRARVVVEVEADGAAGVKGVIPSKRTLPRKSASSGVDNVRFAVSVFCE